MTRWLWIGLALLAIAFAALMANPGPNATIPTSVNQEPAQ